MYALYEETEWNDYNHHPYYEGTLEFYDSLDDVTKAFVELVVDYVKEREYVQEYLDEDYSENVGDNEEEYIKKLLANDIKNLHFEYEDDEDREVLKVISNAEKQKFSFRNLL